MQLLNQSEELCFSAPGGHYFPPGNYSPPAALLWQLLSLENCTRRDTPIFNLESRWQLPPLALAWSRTGGTEGAMSLPGAQPAPTDLPSPAGKGAPTSGYRALPK